LANQPDILSLPLLRLTSRKPLWLDLQPVDVKSRWRHNWKSAQVVNSHLVRDPKSGGRVSASLGNSGLSWAVFARSRTLQCLQKEIATSGHWSVSFWQDPGVVSHCRILSPDETGWRLVSAALCGWGRCFVADQLSLMKRIREEDYNRKIIQIILEIFEIFRDSLLSLSLNPAVLIITD